MHNPNTVTMQQFLRPIGTPEAPCLCDPKCPPSSSNSKTAMFEVDLSIGLAGAASRTRLGAGSNNRIADCYEAAYEEWRAVAKRLERQNVGPHLLLATGQKQVCLNAASLTDDIAAFRRVKQVLPQTGACSTDRVPAIASSCSPPTTSQNVSRARNPELAAEAPCFELRANQPHVAAEPAK